MKTSLKLGFLGALLLGGIGAWVWQKRQAVELETALASLRAATRENVLVPQPRPARNEELANRETSAQQVRAEIAGVRKEVVQLESAWQRMNAPGPESEVPFTDNRDPEKGPVRVAHFRNVGQATPAAAFQTVVWAVANDRDELVSLLAISPAGREKLHAMVARMTPEMQTRFRPPEKVAGMLLALELLKEDGFQIGETTEPDASGQVKLNVLRARSGRRNLLDKKLPFQRGSVGWQLPITDAMIDSFPKAIESASMHVPPRAVGN